MLSVFMSKLTSLPTSFFKFECFLLNHLSETSQWKIIESRKPKEYIKEAKIAFVQSCIPHDVSQSVKFTACLATINFVCLQKFVFKNKLIDTILICQQSIRSFIWKSEGGQIIGTKYVFVNIVSWLIKLEIELYSINHVRYLMIMSSSFEVT